MLIYHCYRLRAAVAIGAIDIEGGDAMLAEGAFECGAVHRFGCVIPHVFTVALLPVPVLGNRCATLEQEMLSLAGSAGGQYLYGAHYEPVWHRTDKIKWVARAAPLNKVRVSFPLNVGAGLNSAEFIEVMPAM
jgi:hypothetical protein